ncbi:MAG: hypothetical protein ACYTF5_05260 [Planctomycetota bacterium]|jgi:hypothetical protein
MKTRLGHVVFVPILLALAAGASGQSEKLAKDVKFIRGLVTDLRFIELAQHETENLRKVYTEGDEFKQVVQLGIEVNLEGAKRHPVRTERRGLYQKALEQLDTFLERYSGDAVAFEARKTLADACIEFGYFLIEELEIAREETPDKVGGFEEQAGNVFRKGAQACQTVMTALQNQGKETEIDYFIAWLRRGILLREHGHAVKKDRAYLCEQAREVLEELILEIGEETALGQKALFEMAQIDEVLGDLQGAAGSYNDTVEQIIESLDNAPELELTVQVQKLMFDLLQEVYDHLCEVYFQQGDTASVLTVIAKYRKNLEDYGADPHPRFGDALFLMEARVQAESGKQADVTKALNAAKAINRKHPTDFVGLKAKKLLDVILSRSSDLVTGDVLLEVAKGYFQEKKYDLAIAGLKKALRGMTEEDRQKLGLEAWNLIGRANSRLERHLEATLAYARGLQEYGPYVKPNDPNATKALADRADRSMARTLRSAGDDPVFGTLKDRVSALVVEYNEEKAKKGVYAEGMALYYPKGQFAKAAEVLSRVPPNYEKYELAVGVRITCLFRARKVAEARKAIAEYDAYVKSPKGQLNEDDRIKRAYRSQAVAWIQYAEGRMLYDDACGSNGTKNEDLTKYPAVIKHFLEFERQYAKHAVSQMTRANEILGISYLKTGDIDKAKDRYEKLKRQGGDKHKFLGDRLFRYYVEQENAAEVEQKAANQSGDAQAITDTNLKLDTARRAALAQGMDYSRSLGRPNYDVMFATMKTAERLQEWLDCEWVATKILKLYGGDQQIARHKSFLRVKPSLGNALLNQSGKMQQAKDILTQAEKDLIAQGKDNTEAYYEVVRLTCLAMGGWPMFDESGNYQAHGGMGEPVEAYKKYFGKTYKKYALHSQRAPRFSLEWYRFHLEAYYFARQAGKVDNKFSGYADTLFKIAKSTDDFESLKKLGKEGMAIFDLFQTIPH